MILVGISSLIPLGQAQIRPTFLNRIAGVPLFEFRAGTLRAINTPYAVTADSQRFLINEIVDKEPNAPRTVVVNWTQD